MGLDSLEILLSVEKEFGVVIDDAEAAHLTTPRRLADYIARCRGGVGADKAPLQDDDIVRRVIRITAAQTGIPEESIHADHRFVQDLGLD